MSNSGRVPMSKKKGSNPEPDWNYEATVAEIEAIVEQVESGQLELAEVFDQFTTAVEYLRQCETFLNERQQQVNLLLETLDEGSFDF
jgi:exodeoxyribonuclease VII small subunit